LPFAATRMDLEGIVQVRRVRQRETNAVWYHLYVDFKGIVQVRRVRQEDKRCMVSLVCGLKKYSKLVNITKKEADSKV